MSETIGLCNIGHIKFRNPKEEMGQHKESDQKRVAIRICPKCAKAFYALEIENATCCFCGTPVAETST